MAPDDFDNWRWSGKGSKLWLGVAVGIAVGLGIAISRRKKSGAGGSQLRDRLPDFAQATREVVERATAMRQEALSLAHDAQELWAHGRKLLRQTDQRAS
jgi:hypothetical protein